MQDEVTPQLMQQVYEAFASHDVDAIVACFAPDGVFDNAIGPEVYGRRYAGQGEIRGYFEGLFASTSNVQWEKTGMTICGNKVFTQWLRTGTTDDGVKQAWQGTDVYTFRDGLIAVKDTYIKAVTPANAG